MTDTGLDQLVQQLEETAGRLRSGELEPKAAAELVDRCAQLALEIGSALDRAGRQADRELPDDGEERSRTGGPASTGPGDPAQEQLL